MPWLHQASITLHIIAGFSGLLFFWIAIAAPKGRGLHLFAGRAFALCAILVSASAAWVSLVQIAAPEFWASAALSMTPAEGLAAAPGLRRSGTLLGYLALVTFTTTWHGVRVVRDRRAPERLARPAYRALLWSCVAAGVAIFALGLLDQQPLLMALAPLGVLVGRGALAYVAAPRQRPMAWFIEHMGAMLGAGIAFHTAFLVFGIRRFSALQLPGAWALLPWILPTIVGGVAGSLWTRAYRRRFADAGASPASVAPLDH